MIVPESLCWIFSAHQGSDKRTTCVLNYRKFQPLQFNNLYLPITYTYGEAMRPHADQDLDFTLYLQELAKIILSTNSLITRAAQIVISTYL